MVSFVQAFIKYQTKPGCEDEFIESLKGAVRSTEHCVSWTVTSLDNGQFMEAIIYNSVDGIVADMDKGLAWLDSVDHLLVKYPCLLYTSPSPRDLSTSRMPSSA